MTLYPEYPMCTTLLTLSRHQWERTKFQSYGVWNNLRNQRHKMDELSSKLSITYTFLLSPLTDIADPKDWYHVTTAALRNAGGSGLYQHFGSMSKLLSTIYPEYHVKKCIFLT